MKAIEINNLGVSFKMYKNRRKTLKEAIFYRMLGKNASTTFWALRNVSFDLDEGEILGVVGRNGGGKSTLFKAIANIYLPDEGEIAVNGQVSTLLSLGTGFDGNLSGRDNIYLNGAFLGLSNRDIDELYEEIVDFAEVREFIDTPVKNYSSGMYSRLAFSIAVNIRPDILLLDEVLGVGDEKFQAKCVAKMQDLMGRARAILLVAHNTALINKTCTKALWIDKGQVMAFGDAHHVTKEYRQFLGLAPDEHAA
jgi:ABC-type polysaccharide/polyol phosphate transport system ATPase subunit